MKNLQKIIKLTTHILIIFLIVVFEIIFIRSTSFPFNYLGLILPTVIYLAVIFNLNLALWWSIIAGFFLDIYSLLPFGAITFALVIAALCIHYLFMNHFTNRSLYSLLFLGFLGTIIYKAVIFGASFLPLLFGKGHQLFYFNFNLLKITLAAVILNSIFLVIMFYLTNLFSKRLKPAYV